MSLSTINRTAASQSRLIIILAMLAAFAPLATDMYLPGFHLMERYFGVPEGGIEITLSTFFFGLAFGQAAYGPFIDRFGRRRPLLAGIALYIVSTGLCLCVSDIHVFTGLRFLQAVGGCSGMIIGRAIVTDIFDRLESARAFSSLLIVMTLAPIIAPIVGGFVIELSGWKPVFVLMLAFGLICFALVWLKVPETLPESRRSKEGPGKVIGVWRDLILLRAFIVPAIVGGLAQACMFAFITGSPFVFMNIHGVSARTYGFLFALIACALIVFSQINRMALKTKSSETLMYIGLLMNVVGAIAAVCAVPSGNIALLLTFLWIAIGALGLISANAAAIAMAATGRHQGSGSALIGVLQFGCAFIVSSLVAASQNGTAFPMTLAMAICSLIATFLWIVSGVSRVQK